MTDEDAMALSTCGYGCNIIGGPFISRNPECPECNQTLYHMCITCDFELAPSLPIAKSIVEAYGGTVTHAEYVGLEPVVFADFESDPTSAMATSFAFILVEVNDRIES